MKSSTFFFVRYIRRSKFSSPRLPRLFMVYIWSLLSKLGQCTGLFKDSKRRTNLFPATSIHDDTEKAFQPAVLHCARVKRDQSFQFFIKILVPPVQEPQYPEHPFKVSQSNRNQIRRRDAMMVSQGNEGLLSFGGRTSSMFSPLYLL